MNAPKKVINADKLETALREMAPEPLLSPVPADLSVADWVIPEGVVPSTINPRQSTITAKIEQRNYPPVNVAPHCALKLSFAESPPSSPGREVLMMLYAALTQFVQIKVFTFSGLVMLPLPETRPIMLLMERGPVKPSAAVSVLVIQLSLPLEMSCKCTARN